MIFFQDDITIESSIIPSIERKTQEINHYISNMRQKELNNYSKISPLVKKSIGRPNSIFNTILSKYRNKAT